jgi:hypothetical protein
LLALTVPEIPLITRKKRGHYTVQLEALHLKGKYNERKDKVISKIKDPAEDPRYEDLFWDDDFQTRNFKLFLSDDFEPDTNETSFLFQMHSLWLYYGGYISDMPKVQEDIAARIDFAMLKIMCEAVYKINKMQAAAPRKYGASVRVSQRKQKAAEGKRLALAIYNGMKRKEDMSAESIARHIRTELIRDHDLEISTETIKRWLKLPPYDAPGPIRLTSRIEKYYPIKSKTEKKK